MTHLFSPNRNRALMLSAALTLGVLRIQATVLPGTVVTTFSNPVLMGVIANEPSAGMNTTEDNTSTAVYSISNGTASSSLSWGSNTPTTAYQTYSQLTFTGSQIPSSNVTTPFQLGTILFTNGTSVDGTTIFGASLNFYDNAVSTANYLGTDQVIITTTSNVFGVPGGLTNGDDDYINICGLQSNVCATSIEAVESSEGGLGVTVTLMGSIVGDPTLTITSLALAPGQTSGTNGFLGTDPPIGATPEPAAWMMTFAGLGLFLLCRRSNPSPLLRS